MGKYFPAWNKLNLSRQTEGKHINKHLIGRRRTQTDNLMDRNPLRRMKVRSLCSLYLSHSVLSFSNLRHLGHHTPLWPSNVPHGPSTLRLHVWLPSSLHQTDSIIAPLTTAAQNAGNDFPSVGEPSEGLSVDPQSGRGGKRGGRPIGKNNNTA